MTNPTLPAFRLLLASDQNPPLRLSKSNGNAQLKKGPFEVESGTYTACSGSFVIAREGAIVTANSGSIVIECAGSIIKKRKGSIVLRAIVVPIPAPENNS